MLYLLKKLKYVFFLSILFSVLSTNNAVTATTDKNNSRKTIDKVLNSLNNSDDEDDDEYYDDDEDDNEYLDERDIERFLKKILLKNSNFAFVVDAGADMSFVSKKAQIAGINVGVGFKWNHKIAPKVGIFVTPGVHFLAYNLFKKKIQDNHNDRILYDSTGKSYSFAKNERLKNIETYDRVKEAQKDENKAKYEQIKTSDTYTIKEKVASSQINFMALGETKIGLSMDRLSTYLKVALGALFTTNKVEFYNNTAKDIYSISENYKSISSLLDENIEVDKDVKYGLDIVKSELSKEELKKNKTSLVGGIGLGLSFRVVQNVNIYAEYTFYLSSFDITFGGVPASFGDFTGYDKTLREKFSHKIHTISVGLSIDFSL